VKDDIIKILFVYLQCAADVR